MAFVDRFIRDTSDGRKVFFPKAYVLNPTKAPGVLMQDYKGTRRFYNLRNLSAGLTGGIFSVGISRLPDDSEVNIFLIGVLVVLGFICIDFLVVRHWISKREIYNPKEHGELV